MGDRPEPSFFGQRWNPLQLQVIERELAAVQPYVLVSGGWAWHLLTPGEHTEYTQAHNHDGADLFVPPPYVAPLLALLSARGYTRVWSGFDRLPSDADFTRYARTIYGEAEPVKVVFDLFVADVPCVDVGGFRVVAPSHLLSLDGHSSSDRCLSALIARELIARGEDVVGHPALAKFERFFQ
jgi:hypothetical protein